MNIQSLRLDFVESPYQLSSTDFPHGQPLILPLNASVTSSNLVQQRLQRYVPQNSNCYVQVPNGWHPLEDWTSQHGTTTQNELHIRVVPGSGGQAPATDRKRMTWAEGVKHWSPSIFRH